VHVLTWPVCPDVYFRPGSYVTVAEGSLNFWSFIE